MSPAHDLITRLTVEPAPDLLTNLYAEVDAPALAPLLSLWRDGRAELWGVRAHGGIAAVAWFSKVLDECELLDIRVSEAHRGRGCGGRLLKAALAAYDRDGVRCCHLEVRASNVVAGRLYERCGFDAVGRRANYYRSGSGREDAILMTRIAKTNGGTHHESA